jgi:hypothetical protein
MKSARWLVALMVVAFIALSLWVRSLRASGSLPEGWTASALPPGDRSLVEFLLMLPIAAVVCSIARNIVGLHTFGTFAPALLGLAFRDATSPIGVFLLMVVLSIGWILRRGVSFLNLLQVPRASLMLGCVCTMLVGYIFWSNANGRPLADAIPFLPLVIVTGLIERFWLMEEEDGTPAAVRTMLTTLGVAIAVYAVARIAWVFEQATAYPESIGIVMAVQILVGRYTGYRLMELYRFREMTQG